MRDIPIFTTHDCDLAAFLMLQGLKYIECKKDVTSSTEKPRAVMHFFDEKGIAKDLERVFMNHEINRYSAFRKYILKEVHRSLKGL